MRKPDFPKCENKRTDRLHSHRFLLHTAYVQNFKPLDIFCGCTVRFVSDLVGNPEDRFSGDVNQFPLRERLRTHKVFTKDQCFYLNYHKFSIKSYVLDMY